MLQSDVFYNINFEKNVARNLKNRPNVAKSMLQRFSKITKMLQKQNVEIYKNLNIFLKLKVL